MATSEKRLSNSMVDALVPTTTCRIVWDRDLKGFGLRITPAGAKAFVIQFRDPRAGGASKRLTIGRFASPWTVEAARQEAQRRLLRVATGEQAEAQATPRPTFAEVAARYTAEHSKPKKKPGSAAEDARNLRLHILPVFGRRLFHDITRADIADFHASRRAFPINANRCLALLSHIFTLADVWGLREGENPCRRIQKYRERSRERFLTPEEIARLGVAIAGGPPGRPWQAPALIRLLLLTGARRGELEGLRWAEVRLDQGALCLGDSKTGAKRIPIGPEASDLIAALPRYAGSPFVFPAERGDGRFVGLPKIWREIRAEAGLEDVRLHDLRHSFASVAASSGVPLAVIGRILGHADTRTTQRYAHLFEAPVAAGAAETSGHVARALGGFAPARISRLRTAS